MNLIEVQFLGNQAKQVKEGDLHLTSILREIMECFLRMLLSLINSFLLSLLIEVFQKFGFHGLNSLNRKLIVWLVNNTSRALNSLIMRRVHFFRLTKHFPRLLKKCCEFIKVSRSRFLLRFLLREVIQMTSCWLLWSTWLSLLSKESMWIILSRAIKRFQFVWVKFLKNNNYTTLGVWKPKVDLLREIT